jgi:phage replication-related protein YjqB (UPF0714/DUF867 family)
VLAEASPTVIAVHGEESAEEVVFLGGLDEERQKKFRDSLIASGFTVKQHHNPLLQGTHDANKFREEQRRHRISGVVGFWKPVRTGR